MVMIEVSIFSCIPSLHPVILSFSVLTLSSHVTWRHHHVASTTPTMLVYIMLIISSLCSSFYVAKPPQAGVLETLNHSTLIKFVTHTHHFHRPFFIDHKHFSTHLFHLLGSFTFVFKSPRSCHEPRSNSQH